MKRKKSYITVTDQFCGAGGSSQGVRRVSQRIKGVEVKLALNHWKLAIETHNSNFPETIHDCTDISACDPRRYPSTDILITSPECTNHSLAKGVKIAKKQMDLFNSGKIDPAAERSRATMWDVCRFAEYHSYNIIIVENVVDARKWVMFDAWINAMHLLGYNHKCVYLNSMHCHPTPQSRDRMYVVFWKKGNRVPELEYTPSAWCSKCATDVPSVQTWKNKQKQYGKYRQQYVYCCPECSTVVEPYYYAAMNCIDWHDVGTRIGDRNKALSENTLKRIEYGLKKYGNQLLAVHNYSPGYCSPLTKSTGTITTSDQHGLLTPFIMHSAYGKEARGIVRPVSDPAFTQTTLSSQAIVQPFLIDDKQTTGVNFRVRGASEATCTVHTDPRMKVIMPFIVKGEHSSNDKNAQSVSGVLQTQTTRQSMALVSPPLIVENKKTSKSRPVTNALGAVTSVPYHGLLSPESWKRFISYYYGTTNHVSPITSAANTVRTKDCLSLVSYKEPQIEDCYYRMLKPHEIQLAMAFDRDYIVLGSGRDKVKQLGNAVTPPAMEWLVERCIESLN